MELPLLEERGVTMKILAAIDSSEPSCRVIEEIIKRPWPSPTTVCVLHVIDWPQLPSGPSLIERFRQSAEELVNSACAKLTKAGLQTTREVFEGHPRADIPDYAGRWGADLILVGNRGTSTLVRFLLGSTAQAVLRNSPCSVEIVRARAGKQTPAAGAMKVLLATDGSECSIAAVKAVATRPWPNGTQMRVVSVIPVVMAVGGFHPLPPIYLPGDVLETLQTEARSRAEEAISRAQDILSRAGIQPVQPGFLPIGDAREVILDEAAEWGADLIVLGSHGYRGLNRLMLGSVSESVATHAPCSVEVIREPNTNPNKRHENASRK
jgi:nucleotide-binding universal stress UspA family protein